MLIAIDHGNKQVKTVHGNAIVSGVQKSKTRPYGRDVLKYGGSYYTLSAQRIPYQKDKTTDERFFILSLFAIAEEIEAQGAYTSGEKEYPVKLEDNKTITDNDAANFIASTHYWNVSANTLVVEAELINGSLLSEIYSCPISCDLDEEEAKRICMRQIYEKVKFLLAFLLQCAKPEQRFRGANEKG